MTSERQTRSIDGAFKTRDAGAEKYISGYFAVFDSIYYVFDGATESIDKGAFDGIEGEDIRCLIDHDTRLVLGRTAAGTLTLSVDEHGLFGEVKINEKDQDAVNLYERVKRGDVTQCSFGFDILDEKTEQSEEGVHWTIKRVKLYEVSVTTFPAYEETGVEVRKAQIDEIRARRLFLKKQRIAQKLKGARNGVKNTNVEKKD